MLDRPWVLLSELLDNFENIHSTDIKYFEENNIPLTSMICTGVGQGGDVYETFYDIMAEIKKKKTEKLERILAHALSQLKNSIKLPWYLKSGRINTFRINRIVRYFTERIEKTRNYKNYYHNIQNDPYKIERFKRFYDVSEKKSIYFNFPSPDAIIFGHTHVPTYNNFNITFLSNNSKTEKILRFIIRAVG